MLPVELLYVIIFYFVDSRTPGRTSSLARDKGYPWRPVVAIKPEWHEVQPLTLVSKVFREIVLEAWFQTYVMYIPKLHLSEEWLSTIPGVVSWTRILHCIVPYQMIGGVANGFFNSEMDLTMFTHLRKVQFDAHPYEDAYVATRTLRLGIVLPTVLEFELRYHLRPSPDQLVHMPNVFPNLQVLDLHQERAWCSLCDTCNILHLDQVPPSSVTYNNGDGLPKLYNRHLASLPHLRTVRLSAAYTLDGEVCLQELSTPWRGECGECTARFLTDEDFTPEWEAQNKAEPHPPSLREVVWTFAPATQEALDAESGSDSEDGPSSSEDNDDEFGESDLDGDGESDPDVDDGESDLDVDEEESESDIDEEESEPDVDEESDPDVDNDESDPDVNDEESEPNVNAEESEPDVDDEESDLVDLDDSEVDADSIEDDEAEASDDGDSEEDSFGSDV
ncbi:uncharacterized protein B0H18DRAFT_465037 [Fomitopsis serialis]|uniref:uncharacterized protein n=1 Tax=Fomitopsis serialis TaxID=139415 RepID=UPI002007C710|nr:uncharacterized protein B0H18DRAFT_465037 [Neoantrodia serialis]KAH9923530.1 hypothetical protein B0H18DRAFT_465037 [Neoantrodia serialis]